MKCMPLKSLFTMLFKGIQTHICKYLQGRSDLDACKRYHRLSEKQLTRHHWMVMTEFVSNLRWNSLQVLFQKHTMVLETLDTMLDTPWASSYLMWRLSNVVTTWKKIRQDAKPRIKSPPGQTYLTIRHNLFLMILDDHHDRQTYVAVLLKQIWSFKYNQVKIVYVKKFKANVHM